MKDADRVWKWEVFTTAAVVRDATARGTMGWSELIEHVTAAGIVAASTGLPYRVGGRGIRAAARACRKYLMEHGRLAEHAAVRRCFVADDGTRDDGLTAAQVRDSNDNLSYDH